MRHVSVPKPPGRATRRQGNADLRSAQPAAGGRREGPRVGGASRSGPGVQRCADGGGPCFSLRFAQRCRPEVGVPLPVTREGRRSLAVRACGDTWFRCASRSGADSEVGVPLPVTRERVPTGGRRSLACAIRGFAALSGRDAGRRPALHSRAFALLAVPAAVVRQHRGETDGSGPGGFAACLWRLRPGAAWLCAVSTASRRSVPVGDRRSRAVGRRRGLAVCGFAALSGSGAGRRPALLAGGCGKMKGP